MTSISIHAVLFTSPDQVYKTSSVTLITFFLFHNKTRQTFQLLYLKMLQYKLIM